MKSPGVPRHSPPQPGHEYGHEYEHALEQAHEDVHPTPHALLPTRAARAARATVIAFIRSRLPAGSDDAISDDELAAGNATRVSREPFAPTPP